MNIIEEMGEKENKWFTSLVINEFIEWLVKYGEFPTYLHCYRACKFYKQEGTDFYYLYPFSDTTDQLYKLSVPKEFINRAMQIHEILDKLNQDIKNYKDKVDTE